MENQQIDSNILMKSFFWKASSCAAFAMINGLAKYLGGHSSIHIDSALPVFTIIFFQHLFASLILAPYAFKNRKELFNKKHANLHIARVVSAVTGIGFWYSTLKFFPIAQSVALSFMGPILTILGATLILKEQLSFLRMSAISLSFIGAFIILQGSYPVIGDQSFNWVILLPLASASTLVISKLSTKQLTKLGEKPNKLTIYLILFMTPVSFFYALPEFQLPELNQIIYLVALAFLSLYAHLAFSKAYSLADVTFLMPLGFTKFLMSALVGWVAFSETPTSLSLWFGLSIILFSTILLSMEHKKIPAKS